VSRKPGQIHLEARRVSKNFGGLQAVHNVSFEIHGPELIGLIGPNGAGKTTLTNLLDGALNPSSGTIYLNGRRLGADLSSHPLFSTHDCAG
jgi:branched-chain amino acid transport system ATP-binding protein